MKLFAPFLALLFLLLAAACDRHSPEVTIPGFQANEPADASEEPEKPTAEKKEFFPGRSIE